MYIPTPTHETISFDIQSVYGGAGKASSPVINDTKRGWELRRDIARSQATNQIRSYETSGSVFFQNNWEPVVACAYERRMGNAGDGGKWICDPDNGKTKRMLIYSLGSNNDYSFETAMHDFYENVEIHTFDAGVAKNKPDFVRYHPYWISGSDLSPNKRSLSSLITELGHADRTIDVLKIDIEGSEHEALMPAIRSGVFSRVNQLQLEVHLAWNAFGYSMMTPYKIHEMMVALAEVGMHIFHKEANTLAGGDACEFSFVKVYWESQIA